MNVFATLLLLSTAIGMLTLSRRWAPLPLLVGACYMTNAQSIDLGPFHFTVLRILLLVGLVRSIMRNEKLPGGLKGVDRVVLAWSAWMIFSSVFHQPFGDALVFRLGAAYNFLGIYFLTRIFCQNTEDLVQIIKIMAFILVPVALEMLNELITRQNMFGFLGGVPPEVIMREGKLRAQGPFGHAILAGTVGGVCLPLMIGIWRMHPRTAKIGFVACLFMVITSNSSGPIMSVALGVIALIFWWWRRFIPVVRISAVLLYFIFNIIMTRPAYYLLERIDLTGSSAGYHRAAIIDAAVTNWKEWIVGGTDYTRHWMPYGVSWSLNHCDLTNHYLWIAVDGGLPVMVLFIFALVLAFRYVRESLRLLEEAPIATRFLVWSVGAGLFAHVTTMVSIAYFEQSVMFLYLNLAAVVSLHAITLKSAEANKAHSHSGFSALHQGVTPAY